MSEKWFCLEMVTNFEGKKVSYIQKYEKNGIEYVDFYMNGHLIRIPYECMVCFVSQNIVDEREGLPSTPEEKLIIALQMA